MTTKHIKYTNEIELIQTKSSVVILKSFEDVRQNIRIKFLRVKKLQKCQNLYMSHSKEHLLLVQKLAFLFWLSMPQMHWAINSLKFPSYVSLSKYKIVTITSVDVSELNYETSKRQQMKRELHRPRIIKPTGVSAPVRCLNMDTDLDNLQIK